MHNSTVDYNSNSEKEVKRPIELYQAVIATCLLILTIGTIIVNQSTKITTLQNQMIFMNDYLNSTKMEIKEMNTNIKEMNGKMTDVLIALQNKQDRAK